jgi:hypothetical protein
MSNKQQILIGSDNFKKMITNSDVFVDKSIFIKEIIDSKEDAILITKPRRWGKTSNLDMLKTFFAIEVDDKGVININSTNKILFTGGYINDGAKQLTQLNIARVNNGSYIDEYFGKYPVIFITLKDVTGNSLAEIKSKLAESISHLFLEHSYLYEHMSKDDSLVSRTYSKKFERIVNKDDSKDDLHSSLKFLSELLFKYHGKRAYILVDEYDKPYNYLLKHNEIVQNENLMQNVTMLVTGILSEAGKTNAFLEKIVLTGIFDNLKKEGESGFNNINVYGVLSEEFSLSFGFSQKEIDYLIDKLDLNDASIDVRQVIKEWYNGYITPVNESTNIQVYTPWAVVRYLHAAVNGKFKAESYWSKTATDSLLRELLKSLIDKNIEDKLFHLSKGEEISFKFDKEASLLKYDSLKPIKNEAAISYLLLHSGYLTARVVGKDYTFKVPNLEVQNEFTKVIEEELESLHNRPSDELIKIFDGLDSNKSVYEKALLKLLNQLQGNKVQQAIDLIIAKDINGLENLIKQDNYFECEDKHFNFNLLHIGAISGDKEIFSKLLKVCDPKLYFKSDKLNGLKLADFAFLSGEKAIIESLEDRLIGTKSSIEVPNVIESLICTPIGAMYVGYNLIGASILTASIKVCSKLFTPREITIREQLAIASATDIGLNIAKETIKYFGGSKFNLCDRYEVYNKVNSAVPPSFFSSLKQFEKYILEHPKSYVSLSNECVDSYHSVAKIEIPVSVYNEEAVIMFGLCESNESGEL